MRQAIVVGLSILFMGARAAVAQPAGGDGTLLEQTPCPAYVAPQYDEAVASAKQFYGEEATAARREGITMRTPLAYATPE